MRVAPGCPVAKADTLNKEWNIKFYIVYIGFYKFSVTDLENLTEDEKNSINIVLRDYGGMKPYDLRELSHSEAPWKDARNGLPEGAKCKTVITKGSMGEYYGSL